MFVRICNVLSPDTPQANNMQPEAWEHDVVVRCQQMKSKTKFKVLPKDSLPIVTAKSATPSLIKRSAGVGAHSTHSFHGQLVISLPRAKL